MEVKVYKKTEQLEQPIFFDLQQQSNRIDLVVVDSNGQRAVGGTILSIDTEGLYLNRSINRDFGLPLNKKGIIKIYNLNEIYKD